MDLQDQVQRLSTSLSEALNTNAAQELENRALKRQLSAAKKVPAANSNESSEKLAADLAAAQARVAAMEAEMADLSSSLLEQANLQVREANVKAAEAVQRAADTDSRAKDTDKRRVRQIAEIEENHEQQIAVLQAMIEAGQDASAASSVVEAPTMSSIMAPPAVPNLGTRSVKIDDDDDFAEALDAAAWSSPLRPICRTDLSDYNDFLALANTATEMTAAVKAHADGDDLLTSWRRKPKLPALTAIKFAARTIIEDVDPCLRLETAVHLSWLVRRSWHAALLAGTLAIEPVSAAQRLWSNRPSSPCCLCGENRRSPQYERIYVVRIPKDPTLYMVGLECVVRVRFACEYIAFLRSLRDGVRKLDTLTSKVLAWQECLRLREQLFWARAGGFWAMERARVDRAYKPERVETVDSETDLTASVDGPAEHAEQAEQADAPDHPVEPVETGESDGATTHSASDRAPPAENDASDLKAKKTKDIDAASVSSISSDGMESAQEDQS